MKQKTRVAKRREKRRQGGAPGKGNSNYARKVEYCWANNVRACDVPFPKPWRMAK